MNHQNVPPRPLHAATRRQVLLGAAAFGGLAMGSLGVWAAVDEGISTEQAIHQEPIFHASREQVFATLTDAQQFDKVAQLSAAMQNMPTGGKPTAISRLVGGAFALFGGYITGLQIELILNERITQAWRSQSWKPGEYSIVRFQFADQGAGTKILFDHRGFPDGQAQNLVHGWQVNYWQPLEKYLAQK
jgi:activator of HSP90 ATPase